MAAAFLRRVATPAVVLVAAACSSSAPPPATGPLRETTPVRGPFAFAVIGDFGTGEDAELRVAAELREWAADRGIEALVTTGDNIYETGDPADFGEAWVEPYGWVSRRGIEVVASLGNHDIETAAGAPVMHLLGMPNPWYARRFGPVEFVVLDSNSPHDVRQASFVGRTLGRAPPTWRIAVFHHPPYSCGAHGGDEEVRAAWGDALAAGGVDLVLSGHDHNYQRFPPIDGLRFVVSGGGGADLHEVEGCDPETPAPVAELDHAHHFLVGIVGERSLRIVAVGVPGGPFDRFTVRAPQARTGRC